jgi:hypothetical protein
MKTLIFTVMAVAALALGALRLWADPPQRDPFRPPPLPGQPERDPTRPFDLPPPPQTPPIHRPDGFQAPPPVIREEAPEDVVRALTDALKDKDLEVRKIAAATLVQLRQGKKAISLLVELLNNKDAETRKFAVEHLTAAGPDAMDALTEALKSEDRDTRANAAYTLARIGPAAAPAARSLLKLIKDDDADVRRRVVYALHRMYADDFSRPSTLLPPASSAPPPPGPTELGPPVVSDPGVLLPPKK